MPSSCESSTTSAAGTAARLRDDCATLAISAVGKALTGVRAGDVARVVLPSGEIRVLSVLDVVPRSDATAEAA